MLEIWGSCWLNYEKIKKLKKTLRKPVSNVANELNQLPKWRTHEISNRLFWGLGVVPETDDEIYVSISIGKYKITVLWWEDLCFYDKYKISKKISRRFMIYDKYKISKKVVLLEIPKKRWPLEKSLSLCKGGRKCKIISLYWILLFSRRKPPNLWRSFGSCSLQ